MSDELEKEPTDPQIGDYVSFEWLVAHGGKFYATIDGTSYCDTPLASFILTPEGITKGYRRIE